MSCKLCVIQSVPHHFVSVVKHICSAHLSHPLKRSGHDLDGDLPRRENKEGA